MDVIIMTRGAGKTMELIRISAQTGHHIVCNSKDEAARILADANKMKLSIPTPITYGEFLGRAYYGAGIKGFLIDDLEMLLRGLTPVPIYAATMTGRIVTDV